MSRADVLRTIKDAEADATATLAKAQSDASNIVTKARVAATETVSSGRTQAQADSQQMVDDARAAAQKEANKVSKKGDKGGAPLLMGMSLAETPLNESKSVRMPGDAGSASHPDIPRASSSRTVYDKMSDV